MKIKPLYWERDDIGDFYADTVIGEFSIKPTPTSEFRITLWTVQDGSSFIKKIATTLFLEDAYREAQRYFEEAIRSALE